MNDLIQVSTDASYAEMREAQRVLNEQIAAKAAEARAEALSRIVADIKEFGFTADELNSAITGKKKPGRKAGSAGTGTKAAPKYRNPENADQTWTGRGVAPNWIKVFPKDEWSKFLIEAPAAAPAETASEAPAEVAPVAEAPSADPVASPFEG